MRENGQITEGHCEPPDGPKRNMSFRHVLPRRPFDMSFRDVLLDMSFTFGEIGATSAAGMLERIQQSTVHVIEVAKISQRQPGAAGFSCSKFNLSNSHVTCDASATPRHSSSVVVRQGQSVCGIKHARTVG